VRHTKGCPPIGDAARTRISRLLHWIRQGTVARRTKEVPVSIKEEFRHELFEAAHFMPTRTWRSFWYQLPISLVVAAVILAFLAVVANDVPWMLMGAVILSSIAWQAVLVAVRVHRRRQR
jgi:hypothetical protein